jgi:multiple sugar transport system substrate-binding protein
LKKLKIIYFILFVTLAGCTKDSDNKTVIDFWALGGEGEYLKQIIPEFERKNPGIKVNVQIIPWNAAQEKLITAYASDNTPDACQLGNTWIPQFVSLNAIINLDGFIKKSSVIKSKKYFEGIWDTNIIDSSAYGIPWYIDTRIMFYRKDILKEAGFDEPPKTWDELYNASKKIREMNKGKEKYAIYIPTNEWANFIIFGLQANSTILKNNNTLGNFSAENFKEAFDFLIKFHKENLSPVGITQVTNVYQALADGYFAMYISGPWHIPEFKKWMTGDLKDKWMTASLPGPNDTTAGISLAGGASLVIFKNSEKKDEVWKFFEFLSESRTQIKFYHLINDLPAVKEAWEDSSLKNDPYMKAFYEQFNNVVPTPKIPEWEQIAFSKLQNYIEIAARGAMTTEAALLALDKDVDKILEKRRWILSKEKN